MYRKEGSDDDRTPTVQRKLGWAVSQGRWKHRGPRKKKPIRENNAFLDMQGGRTEQKWGKLVKAIQEENIVLFAVVDSHLRDQEVPPC